MTLVTISRAGRVLAFASLLGAVRLHGSVDHSGSCEMATAISAATESLSLSSNFSIVKSQYHLALRIAGLAPAIAEPRARQMLCYSRIN